MTVDMVVAKVNNEIITLSAVVERAELELARYQAMGIRDLPSLEEARTQALEQMIDEKLLVGVAQGLGMTVEESKVQNALDDIRKRGNLTEEQLAEMLKQEGRTMEEYKERIRHQILISQIINLEVRSRIKISEKEIADYYDAHRKDFWAPSKVHARHILFILDEGLEEEQVLKKQQKAAEALAKIRDGAEFVEIARQYSEDVTARTGGDLGILEKGKMVPEFEEAVFSLKKGEVSDIVRSPYGLHIIQVEEVIPGAPIPFDEVSGQIEETLKQERFRTVYEEYIEGLRARSFIEKKLEALRPKKDDHPIVVRQENETTVQKEKAGNMMPPVEVGSKETLQKEMPAFKEFESLEKKLKYYKNLRDMNLITEKEYHQRQKTLLDNL